MRVGIIGDTHFPFVHPMYLRFVQDIFEQWDVDTAIHIGDVNDLHAVSFHEHDPDGRSPEDECGLASEHVEEWKREIDIKKVCIGNHDDRIFRLARRVGLPARFLKDYAEVWGTPDWRWDFSHVVDGVLYEHGTGSSGKDAAFNRALQQRRSLVIGHVHTDAGAKFHANDADCIFGLNVGCGIDRLAYAFAYGRAFVKKPLLGCGIVLDGEHAYFERMPCGKGQPYHRSRAGKKK